MFGLNPQRLFRSKSLVGFKFDFVLCQCYCNSSFKTLAETSLSSADYWYVIA